MILAVIFPILIIAAVIAYFYKRKKKLEIMGLRDKIDDMFGDL